MLMLAMAAAAGGAYVIINMNRHVPAVVGRTPAEQPPLPPDNLRPNAPDAPADTPASPESSDPSSVIPKPDTKLEVELTTAVTPPPKSGPTGAELSKPKAQPQPKATSRHSAIPPLSLSAPVSGDDNPRPATAEPPPSVPSGPAAETNSDIVGKLGATANTSIPRPTATPPPEAASLPAGGKVKDPKLIWSVPPTYPVVAKQNNIQGDVKIEATISETGRVSRMKVISGPPLLQQPAMDALRQWKYEPSTLDGKPVAVQLVVTVQFRR